MPKRTPRQPTTFVDRYRARLSEEMESKKMTDRSLADKLTEARFPISFSAIYKTRTGTRQPAMDECYAVAHALGFGSLDDFLEGPIWQRVFQAEQGVVRAYRDGAERMREDVTLALLELGDVVNDSEVADWMDTNLPMWREQTADALKGEVDWAWSELTMTWQMLARRVPEVLGSEDADA